MQDAASVLTDRFAEVLARLPADLDLDDLAMESKAIQRRREVVDGAALLRIALARGPGGLSLRQTAAWASMQGIAELSNPGVKYRLDQATEFLAALVERLLAAKLPGPELRWPGRTVRLAVSFHQVVYPVLSGEAGVAKLQHLLGGPDERSSECPAHAAQSSRTGAAGGGRGTDADGRRGRLRRHRQNRAQGGGALPDRRRQRPAGSLLPAPSPPQADAGSHGRDHRSPPPPALDGPANRRCSRCLAGYDQPHPQAPWPQPHPGA